MDPFTREDLKRLVETDDAPVVSIYMPTYRAGRDVQQNATRFKNLINAAGERLDQRFPDAKSLKKRLKEVAKLEADDEWWQHQSDGLALFLDDKRFDRYRVPLHFDELVTVGSRFQVRPVVRLIQGDGRFYVLAVSQNRVRLLEGSHYSIDELDANQLPSDLRSALNIDEYISALQQHSTGGPNTSGTMIFHGHGAADMDVQKKDEIQQFFHLLDDALNSYLGQDNVPLVFAGVEYLFPLFRETCRYTGLVDEPVTGNPDDLQPDELHTLAWAVVKPQFTTKQDLALERFHDAGGGPKAITELFDIIPAARQGAVDILLLAEGERQWATINEKTEQFKTADEHAEDAEELLNYVAVYTLTAGGTVYCLPYDRMPDQKQAAALLRFPMPST